MLEGTPAATALGLPGLAVHLETGGHYRSEEGGFPDLDLPATVPGVLTVPWGPLHPPQLIPKGLRHFPRPAYAKIVRAGGSCPRHSTSLDHSPPNNRDACGSDSLTRVCPGAGSVPGEHPQTPRVSPVPHTWLGLLCPCAIPG